MFEYLKKYKRIIITGPQRAGTRIGAKMIAHDTGHEYIDETVFNVSHLEKLNDIMKYEENIVIQGPGISAFIERYSNSENLIVFMMRPVNDIKISEVRIKWNCHYEELKKYGREDGDPSEVKYEEWKKQKKNVLNWLEIDYDSLSTHSLWIEKSQRLDFIPSQTTI